jgi:hypothetical protein
MLLLLSYQAKPNCNYTPASNPACLWSAIPSERPAAACRFPKRPRAPPVWTYGPLGCAPNGFWSTRRRSAGNCDREFLACRSVPCTRRLACVRIFYISSNKWYSSEMPFPDHGNPRDPKTRGRRDRIARPRVITGGTRRSGAAGNSSSGARRSRLSSKKNITPLCYAI